MANNVIETVMGAVVLTVAGGFLYFAYSNSSVKQVDGYVVTADFSNINGIGLGSVVRVCGIKVGVVESLKLDETTYEAVAKMRIEESIKLPLDSSAAVQSAGLLGEKFISIAPGGDDVMLKDGGVIAYTQASVNLEEMIGKFMFSGGGVSASGDKKSDKDAESSLSTGIE